MRRKELLQRAEDDGDSMLSSATSDTSSTKRKRCILSQTMDIKSLQTFGKVLVFYVK